MRQLGKGAEAARMKRLGEMNAEELWDTTMNPATRVLLQVPVDDVAAVNDTFEKLLGPDVEPRKKFIQAAAKRAWNLDIRTVLQMRIAGGAMRGGYAPAEIVK